MKVRFSKLSPEAITPTTAKEGDAGFDLTAIRCEYIEDPIVPYWNYEFDLAVEIPSNHVGLIFPRSSISKKDLMLTNSVGVLDSGYRGALTARFKATGKNHFPTVYNPGDRVVQLVIVPYLKAEFEEVPYDQLSKTDRGTGGFGSTGS